jgi:hypothetical protein
MIDRTTYRKYAEECPRLATDGTVKMIDASCWSMPPLATLAEEAEREAANKA